MGKGFKIEALAQTLHLLFCDILFMVLVYFIAVDTWLNSTSAFAHSTSAFAPRRGGYYFFFPAPTLEDPVR